MREGSRVLAVGHTGDGPREVEAVVGAVVARLLDADADVQLKTQVSTKQNVTGRSSMYVSKQL